MLKHPCLYALRMIISLNGTQHKRNHKSMVPLLPWESISHSVVIQAESGIATVKNANRDNSSPTAQWMSKGRVKPTWKIKGVQEKELTVVLSNNSISLIYGANDCRILITYHGLFYSWLKEGLWNIQRDAKANWNISGEGLPRHRHYKHHNSLCASMFSKHVAMFSLPCMYSSVLTRSISYRKFRVSSKTVDFNLWEGMGSLWKWWLALLWVIFCWLLLVSKQT